MGLWPSAALVCSSPESSGHMLSLLLATTLTDWPATRAERTDFKETSTYADAIEHMETLETLGGAAVTVS